MKGICRICVAGLLLGLLLGITTATAEGNAAPPSWCSAEDYIYIPTSDVYHKSCWERILQIRDEVSNGKIVSTADIFESEDGYDAGLSFELGLIAFQSALNADSLGRDFMEEPLAEAENHFRTVAEAEPEGELQRLAWLWYARCGLLASDPDGTAFQEGMAHLAAYPDFPARERVVTEGMRDYIPEEKLSLIDAPVILLDGQPLVLSRDSWPEVVENRTMLPIRALAESIGCWVEWDGGNQTVTIQRAGDVLTFTMGSGTATLGGLEFSLETAPYVRDGRTFLPARAFLETMEQSVEWVRGPNVISVTENRSLAGESAAIEDWVLALSAIGSATSFDAPEDPMILGGAPRSSALVSAYRKTLGFADGLAGRSEATALCNESLNAFWEECQLGSTDMLFYAGKLATDVQYMYGAGYFTYRDVLYWCQEVMEEICDSFDSWNEVKNAYVEHFRMDGVYAVIYDVELEARDELMRQYPGLFDEALFQAPLQMMDEPCTAALPYETITLLPSGDKIPALSSVSAESPLISRRQAAGIQHLVYEASAPGQNAAAIAYADFLCSLGYTIDEEMAQLSYKEFMEQSGYVVDESMTEQGIFFFLRKQSVSERYEMGVCIISPWIDGEDTLYIMPYLLGYH